MITSVCIENCRAKGRLQLHVRYLILSEATLSASGSAGIIRTPYLDLQDWLWLLASGTAGQPVLFALF